MQEASPTTLFYPDLGSLYDLGYVRVSGAGIGNGLYNYFHAMVLAEKSQGTLIYPPWFSLKLGPLLRGEMSKRLYWRLFKPYPSEISGIGKLFAYLRNFFSIQRVTVDATGHSKITPGELNIVTCKKFTFNGLHEYRVAIRQRLLAIINEPIPADHSWGKGGFVGIHVRLGDFAAAQSASQVSSGVANTRIPMSWYVNLIHALKKCYPQMPIRIFSDGQDSELEPLLSLGATTYRSGSDILDLLAMSSASILVGSNSTYSRWAAYLGNMPTIWLDTVKRDEKPSAEDAPILFVPLDTTEPVLWP